MAGDGVRGWDWKTIGEVAEVIGGGTPSTKNPANFGGDIPWITPNDLATRRGRYIERGERNLTKAGLRASSARLLPAGTVLVSSRAPIGYVAIAGNPVSTNQGFRSLVLRDGNVPEFFYYLMSSSKALLERSANGTTFKEISGSSLKQIRIRVPPVEEQRAIARILGAFDDKVELNHWMSGTLEEIARALFQSWFVDFDPVRAKAQGRSLRGLSKEVEAAFPDALEDSPFGPKPEGWPITKIGELVSVHGGSTPSTSERAYWEQGRIAWATPKDLSRLQHAVLIATERSVTERGLKQISSGLLPPGTVLMSSRAPVGYLAVTDIPVAVNQGFIAMVCNRDLPNYYVLHWAQAHMGMIKGRANGTTFQEISKANFRPLPVLLPPPAVLKAFQAQVEPLYARITNNVRENLTLEALRDALKSKLLSGEIRVSRPLLDMTRAK